MKVGLGKMGNSMQAKAFRWFRAAGPLPIEPNYWRKGMVVMVKAYRGPLGSLLEK